MNELMMALGAVLTSGASALFTFLFMKSKYKIEVLQARENYETTAIDNDIKLSGHYKDILDDLTSRYEKRYQEFEEMMNRKFKLLEEELKLKDRKIKLQQDEIRQLIRELKDLRKG